MQDIEGRRALKRSEIHLWFAFPDEIRDPRLLLEYKKLLTPEEGEKQQRFYFERHRHLYLIARALVRTTLSRYTGIPAPDLRFITNEYGRPELDASQGDTIIRFNLSHTEGLIALGVTARQDLGVDVEDMERRGVSTGIADRFFSPREVSDLKKMPENRRRDRFFDYWTLKESYIKARGMGLSIPLEQFSFHLLDKDGIRISFDPGIDDDPGRWCFWQLRPTARHKAAIAISCDVGAEAGYGLELQKSIPLEEESDFDCPISNRSFILR